MIALMLLALQKDVEYAPGKKLDIFLPEKTPAPVILWIHGGGWQAGDKGNCLPARLDFPRRGFAVVSVGYRLSGEAPHPAQIDDCKAALKWVRESGGKHGLDGTRVAAWGSSAGGHLAALLGTTEKLQAVVDYFGPTDLAAFVVTPGYERHAVPSSPESKLLGGPVLENRDKAAAASPVTHVDKGDPPFFIVHGDKDPTVPPDQSLRLDAALRKAGVESTLVMLPGAGHGGPAFTDKALVARVASFLEKHLGPR